jgi:hypothetical protein
MARILTFAEQERFKPTVQWLMHEFRLDEARAWATATDSRQALEFITSPASGLKNLAARRQAMKTVKLSEEQLAVAHFGDGRTIPGTSIQSIRPQRGDLTPPPPANFVRAAQGGGHGHALPQGSDPTPANDSFAEVGGAEYAKRKKQLLASEPAADRIAPKWTGPTPEPSSTGTLRDRAVAYAKARNVSYKIALREVSK